MNASPERGTLADRCRRALREPPTLAKQLGALLLLLLGGILILLAVNWAQNRGEIWGELLFASIILWLGVFVAAQVLDAVLRRLEVPRPTVWQAAIWAVITVLALPIAIAYWPEGVLLFLAPALFLYGVARLLRLHRRAARIEVPLWGAALLGLAMLTVGVVLSPKLERPDDMSLAVATPPVADGEELARRFRPLLFFDSDELFIPLDIEDAVSAGDLRGWKHGLLGSDQSEVDATTDFRDFSYVEVEDAPRQTGEPAGGADSAYYFHAVEPSPGLKPLPATVEGAPDAWNAFPGPWGPQRCLFSGLFCDVHPAPRSPSFQPRYRDPAAAEPWS